MQEIYVGLDDSGKLTNKESVSVYGGIVFLSKQEKDKFITQYRNIILSIQDKYDSEVKNTNIKSNDKRRIINYLKKYFNVALIIQNDEVYSYIKNNKASRGRFVDYSLRVFIKSILEALIKSKQINPNESIKLIINIDEQATKSNGYYNLRDGIYEELKYGITNYNYAKVFKPIIVGDLELLLKYHDSKNCYIVQAADLLAGTVRRELLNNKNQKLNSIIDFQKVIP